MKQFGIIIVIESGDLEQKTKLLVDSIRTFGGEISDAKIWTVKPRKGKAIAVDTLKFLKERNVEFIDINLNKKWHLYGFANKIYATAFIEERYGAQYDALLFLDSDTLVLNEISADILEEKFDVAIKPEDDEIFAPKGAYSAFWKMIYQQTGVKLDEVWKVKTSVTEVEILAYFNSGVVFSNQKTRLFSMWLKNFEILINNPRFYHLQHIEYFFLEQALLTATILKNIPKNNVKLLSNNLNYPLNFENVLKRTEKGIKKEIVILHYHKLLKENWVSEISILPSAQVKWLEQRLPLKVYKKNIVKNFYNAVRYIVWRLKWLLYLRFVK